MADVGLALCCPCTPWHPGAPPAPSPSAPQGPAQRPPIPERGQGASSVAVGTNGGALVFLDPLSGEAFSGMGLVGCYPRGVTQEKPGRG